MGRANYREFNVAWVWGSVPQLELVSRLSQGPPALRGVGLPTRIYRAISATGNNGRLALVNAVIVLTVPMDGVAFVRHVAPTGISCLIGAASSFAKA
jgi:hypothetical protein